MDLNEFKNLDPQRTVSVRFGVLDTDSGSTEWQDHWTDVRLLMGNDPLTKEWTITPLSLDGRPANFYLEGHDDPYDTKGIFASPSTPNVMQVRLFLEPQLLRDCSRLCEQGDYASMQEALEAEFFFMDDLSRTGQVFVEAVDGLIQGKARPELLERLREALGGPE